MIRAFALLLVLALPAAAQETPTVTVALDPAGPVTVGTPVRVALTVLVPSYMPKPPEWPDLQVADAITHLPERATTPVTRRIGTASWSGLVRTYDIVPQRVADFDLSDSTVTLTWAGDDATPQTATLPIPDIAFSATVPPGAEGLDPFLAADTLTVRATTDGLPAAPKPGGAFTLTLTTAASGPPAMLFPPLADRIVTPPGLRAYPKEPALTDEPGARGGQPTARRVENITYVIEEPGNYVLPAVSVDWWNTGTRSVSTASTDAIAFEVAPPPGWKPASTADGSPRRVLWIVMPLALLALAVAGVAVLRRKNERVPRPPSERRLYRELRRTIRTGPVGSLRSLILDWLRRDSSDTGPGPEIEAALREVERTAYGPPPSTSTSDDARRALLAAVANRRTVMLSRAKSDRSADLPSLNPTP